MRQALVEAEKASEKGEVPVGAVLVCQDETVFSAHNLKECFKDPTAHAEMLVLREAAEKLGRWRLGGTLYATLEPCAMCAGALVQARIDRLVFGALDPKGGGCGSVLDVVREPRTHHQLEVLGGVLSEEAEKILKDFFKRLRGQKGS
ncbi:MAG TPA: nucleoside deaminase [Nitrospiria bacterium]|nr:nucleoside deaminase [Candidatus Manganitrophaceae bacterium]HIL34473.1 nucleoside deaminase [Candidatus Manganitrophaceae bacterium]